MSLEDEYEIAAEGEVHIPQMAAEEEVHVPQTEAEEEVHFPPMGEDSNCHTAAPDDSARQSAEYSVEYSAEYSAGRSADSYAIPPMAGPTPPTNAAANTVPYDAYAIPPTASTNRPTATPFTALPSATSPPIASYTIPPMASSMPPMNTPANTASGYAYSMPPTANYPAATPTYNLPTANPTYNANPPSGTTVTTTVIMQPMLCLGRYPCKLTCPNCKQEVITRTSEQVDEMTILAMVLILILFFPLFWLPLVLPQCKTTEHHCTSCNRKVGEQRSCN